MSISVLLIDDDLEYLDILSERLTIRGMEVATAESGVAALDLVRKSYFDVLVLDLQMPTMDGLQVLEQLAAIKPEQPVLLLTGHATVAKGVQAMKLGAADVVEKPVNIRELVEKIQETALQRSKPTKGQTDGRRTENISGLIDTLRRLFSRPA